MNRFSLTHLKFTDSLTFFQNSLTFPLLEKVVSFSRFSSVGGNPVVIFHICCSIPVFKKKIFSAYVTIAIVPFDLFHT